MPTPHEHTDAARRLHRVAVTAHEAANDVSRATHERIALALEAGARAVDLAEALDVHRSRIYVMARKGRESLEAARA